MQPGAGVGWVCPRLQVRRQRIILRRSKFLPRESVECARRSMGEVLVVIVVAAIVFGPMWLTARQSRARNQDASPTTGALPGRGTQINAGQLVKVVVAGGFVANVLDAGVHGFLLGRAYYAPHTELFASGSVAWLVLGNFVAVAVFVGVYLRVRQSFRRGALGGATFGLYAGVLIAFPTHIVLSLVIVDFPYDLAFAWTLREIVWTVTVGAVIGLLLGRAPRRPVSTVR